MIPLFAALVIGLLFRRVSAVIGFILIILICSPFLSMIFVKSEWLVLILGEILLISGLTIVSLAGRLDQTGLKELASVIVDGHLFAGFACAVGQSALAANGDAKSHR